MFKRIEAEYLRIERKFYGSKCIEWIMIQFAGHESSFVRRSGFFFQDQGNRIYIADATNLVDELKFSSSLSHAIFDLVRILSILSEYLPCLWSHLVQLHADDVRLCIFEIKNTLTILLCSR